MPTVRRRSLSSGQRAPLSDLPIELNSLTEGDCLEWLPRIPDGSVDLIACDLPYGATNNAWDSTLPLDVLFTHYKRILKPRGVLALTGQGIFSARLMMAGEDLYRYSLVWRKNKATGHLNAKKMPLRVHEDVLIFYKQVPPFHPQRTPSKVEDRGVCYPGNPSKNWSAQPNRKGAPWTDDGFRMPTSVLDIDCVACSKSLHPTQKPTKLGEWLINSYTCPLDCTVHVPPTEPALILDHCAGVGSFLLAAKNTGRSYIGCELDAEYCRIARERLSE